MKHANTIKINVVPWKGENTLNQVAHNFRTNLTQIHDE